MGAVVNMRPDCSCCALHVPFVDVMNTMLDASCRLPFPSMRMGDPNQAEYFHYMLSYSRMTTCAQANTLDVGEDVAARQPGDDWEPAKYVAKLRTLKTDRNPLLLVTNMQAGHGGASAVTIT